MDCEFYRKIKSVFICVRASSFRRVSRREKLENHIYYTNSLEPFYRELKLHADEDNNHILIYCIDTLLELIDEGEREKINAFADLIHNMPEICMGVRSLQSFYGQIHTFRSKYGHNYFDFIDKH